MLLGSFQPQECAVEALRSERQDVAQLRAHLGTERVGLASLVRGHVAVDPPVVVGGDVERVLVRVQVAADERPAFPHE